MRGDAAGHRSGPRRRSAKPTTDEDVAAFVRQAIGEIRVEARAGAPRRDRGRRRRRGRELGASARGLSGEPRCAGGRRRGLARGAPAAAAGLPLRQRRQPAPARRPAEAASPTAEKDEEPPVSLEPISFEEIAVPAQPAGVPPRLIIAPALQADVAPGEPAEPVSPRPAAREGKPLGPSAKRILPAAGVPATKVLAAADPPASRAAALSERLARRGSRSLANDVGEVTAVDRSFETGERRKRLQLIVAGAAMFCVALGAVALVVRGGDERSRPEIGKARVGCVARGRGAADTTATAAAAEAVPAAPFRRREPQAAEPASPPAPEASSTPPEAAPAPSPTPPAAGAGAFAGRPRRPRQRRRSPSPRRRRRAHRRPRAPGRRPRRRSLRPSRQRPANPPQEEVQPIGYRTPCDLDPGSVRCSSVRHLACACARSPGPQPARTAPRRRPRRTRWRRRRTTSRRALLLYESKRHALALEQFRASYATVPSPNSRLYIASNT